MSSVSLSKIIIPIHLFNEHIFSENRWVRSSSHREHPDSRWDILSDVRYSRVIQLSTLSPQVQDFQPRPILPLQIHQVAIYPNIARNLGLGIILMGLGYGSYQYAFNKLLTRVIQMMVSNHKRDVMKIPWLVVYIDYSRLLWRIPTLKDCSEGSAGRFLLL